MSDKIARLGIERDNDMMYYIKNDGNVWATPRKQKGQAKGKPKKIAETGLKLDYSRYIYYLDGDGDVARKERALGGGGGRRKAPKAAAGPKTPRVSKKAKSKATAASLAPSNGHVLRGRKKSDEQLDREIEECLAKAKGRGGSKETPAASAHARKRGWY